MAFSVKKKDLPTLVPIVVIGSVNVLSALRFSISNITLLVFSISGHVPGLCQSSSLRGNVLLLLQGNVSKTYLYRVHIFSTRLSSEDLSQLQGRK